MTAWKEKTEIITANELEALRVVLMEFGPDDLGARLHYFCSEGEDARANELAAAFGLLENYLLRHIHMPSPVPDKDIPF
jgi:hypothetical protein